jgi:acetyl-CoA acetyltransferase
VTAAAACIVGAAMTEFSSDARRPAERLAIEVATSACADAGVDPNLIDGIVPFPHGPSAEDLITGLGLPDVRFTGVPHLGGASSVAGLRLAAMAVESGQADHVLAFVARNGRSGSRVEARVANLLPGQRYRRNLEHPQGMTTPAQWYSLICRRHMHEFGTTRAHLGEVAVTMRAHAQLNEHAQMYGRPLTMEQYLAGRPIADPYWLYDCCLETDGAGAVLITTADRAADLRQRPVRLAGMAEGHAQSADDIINRRDIFNTGLTKAAPRAFGLAGVGPSDVDAAMIYDCFTFEVIQQLEEAGFCARGQGGEFVADGGIGLGGRLPVNPHGGLLSEGHIAGMNHVVEAVTQLRGQAGERQVAGAEVVAVTGWGDMGDGALAVLTV